MPNIKGSVGKRGKNIAADVKTIQKLLNTYQGTVKFSKLKVDGFTGPKTEGAIGAAQKHFGMKPDFRVDPGKTTIKKLSIPPKVAAKKEEEAKKKEEAKSGGGAPTLEVKGTWYTPKDSAVNLGKVTPRLLQIVNLAAHHYKKKVTITSGYRDDNTQVSAMYNNWPNVKDLYGRINKEPKVKKELTDLHAEGKRKEFGAHMKKTVGVPRSQHTFGKAVDLRKSTDAKVIKALRGLLDEVKESHCYHFQLTKSVSDAKILKAMEKW